MTRGDVVLISFPFSSGVGAKVRPALVVQCDANNRRLLNTIVAMITTSTHLAGKEPTQVLIDPGTPEGRRSGLLCDHPLSNARTSSRWSGPWCFARLVSSRLCSSRR